MKHMTVIAGAVAVAMAMVGGAAVRGQQTAPPRVAPPAASGAAQPAAARPAPPAGYRAPRTSSGQPDLQGIWQVMNTAEVDPQAHHAHLGEPAGLGVVEGGEIPYQPAALAQQKKNFDMRKTADPAAQCFFPGVPRLMYMPHPFQIVQTPTYMSMLFEYGHEMRLIYTTGFRHHEDFPFWMGDARGRWEGETFVVDSTGFNADTWFDKAGNFHSDALHVVERFTRTGPDHIRYDVTIEDPKVFTRPWKMSMPLYRRQEANIQLLEFECFALSVYEGGRYSESIKKAKPAGR